MASNPLVLLLILLSSCVSIAFSESPTPSPPGGDDDSLPCITKLLPCLPYLMPNPPSPPAECCFPLKEVIATEAKCLCQVFNDEDLLRSFNITRDDALALAKACGASPNVSECKTGGAPDSSPATPPSIPSPAPPQEAPPSNSSGAPEGAKNGATEAIPHLFGLGTLIAVSMVFLISGTVGF
ncbi:hypothetical protein BT93_H0342 [Corymbia citriodora subsp. variegata]|nr:hypothetical protein BT93_H0342 [Corymbia citriodora subsp. variegata]